MQAEQKFLHDISNPLAVAYGQLRIIMKKLKSEPSLPPVEMQERVEAALNAFDLVNDKIRERRQLIQQANP